jgi:membrane-bound ClpP family serine protease
LAKQMSNIPRYARIGMLLLVMGAILVGIGTYLSKGSLSLYGFLMVICGFIIYFASSIAARRKKMQS